jgi:CubicO group peptidase (beta-lactamase class C family)
MLRLPPILVVQTILFGGVAAAELPLARPESVGMSSERLERLRSGMHGLVDRGEIPGIVTAVAKDGKVVHFEAVGARVVETGAPMRKDSIFRIYSMSKPITAVAMMMLLEEGKWRLDDPVAKHIPEFANLKVAIIDRETGGVTQVPPDHPMTMRELMTHSSGLTYGLFGATAVDGMYAHAKVLNRDEPMKAMIDKLAKIPLLFQPGERWHYGVGAEVQGYLVEKLSGTPFPQFLEQRIFEPLQMKDTAFHVPSGKIDRFAAFYTYDEDRKFVVHPSDDYTTAPALPSGGSGLVSTVSDYLRFGQMLLNGGELGGVRLLSPRTVELMTKNMLPASKPLEPGIGFGLGFAVIEDPLAGGGYHGPGTYSWSGAAGTWFWIDPVYKLILVGMIQHRGEGTPEVGALSRSLVYQAIMESSRSD